MDEKTLLNLEYPKVLERLAEYAAFSASAELARALRPSTDIDEIKDRLALTSEARHLLSINLEFSVGGARDVRSLVDLARHGGVLAPTDLNDVADTLEAGRNTAQKLEKLKALLPALAFLAGRLAPPHGVIDAIHHAISERGEVLDRASPRLGSLRSEIKVAREKLLSRLERLLNDSHTAPMLQEAIITQRNGRYVIPLRAEFKGRIKAIVHDQSASGATIFIEPLATVELNNHWHELELEERAEERRVLATLSALVGEQAAFIDDMVAALAELDLALMCARYAEDLHASEAELAPFHTGRSDHPGCTLRLYQARHPLLDPQQVVPIDVDFDERTFAIVITGPNTGGKTVTLKTVGLMVLMTQSGLHIPAQSGSALSIFENIYADIGDEQSIEQSLSTFSGHITNIIRILKVAGKRCLVLFDELGAGTDPQEGAALARAILAHLVAERIPCMVATHYPELKAYAHSTPGTINASMEFNLQTLRPTYHLTIGLPGRSNGLLIAERLGMPAPIIQEARSVFHPDELRTEDLLDEIHRHRDLALQARTEAERLQRELEKKRDDLARHLDRIEDERLAVLEKARTEAEAETEALHDEIAAARRELARLRSQSGTVPAPAGQPQQAQAAAIKALESQAEALQEAAQKPLKRKKTDPKVARPLKVGDKVHLRRLGIDGKVTALTADEAEVQAGALRVRVAHNELARPNAEAEDETPELERAIKLESAGGGGVFHPSPGVELDLRGERAEEALERLEKHLESAALAGLPFVRIIHGKGTGKLRQVVRQALGRSKVVSGWESGHDNEGGDGVTVVHLD